MTEEMFLKDYGGLVVKKANLFQQSYQELYSEKLDIRDVVQEAFTISFKALGKYDPNKAKMSTFLYCTLNSLNGFYKKELREKKNLRYSFEDYSRLKQEMNFEEYVMEKFTVYELMMNELDSNSKEIFNWILLSDHNERFSINKLKKHFKDLGWKTRTVNNSLKNIKKLYNKYIK